MALEGTLHDMSLSDLFQVFRLGPKSGILLIDNANERSVIYVDHGRLIDAFVVRGANRQVVATADEAVLHTLDWEDGQFIFRHDLSVTGHNVTIRHDGEWLVLESLRRKADPLTTLPYHQIDLDTCLRLSPLPSNAESSVSLDVDQWRILSYAANSQDLRTICTATGIEPERALRIVAELLSLGLVEVVPPQQPPAPPAPAAPAHVAPKHNGNGLAPVLSLASHTPSVPVAGNPEPQPSRRVGRGLLNTIIKRINEL